MKTLIISLLSLSLFSNVIAQKSNFWYFGENAGVEFTKDGPVGLENGKLKTEEGCASLSDANGKLLFYTSGTELYNRNHEVMPNGKDLMGNWSSTQSGIAVPFPGNPDKYFIFTVDATAGPKGFCYSLVDMKLQNGLGDVVADEKNILLMKPVTEKLTSVTHRNGKDYWVIVHGWLDNEFVAYLVNSEGVSKSPIISKVGKVHEGDDLNTQGYMKFSPDGTNLAVVLEADMEVEVFDFDTQTGVVSNPVSIKMESDDYPYGVEFSPSGKYLYVNAAAVGEIYQFNLQVRQSNSIQESKTLVGKNEKAEWLGALQLGPDLKIYFTQYRMPWLGVIEFPDKPAKECGFKLNAVDLKGKLALLGLPTFIQTQFAQQIKDTVITFFDPKKLEIGKTLVLKNIQFDFNSDVLKEISFPTLNQLVTQLKANPSIKVQLSGHTDNIGNKPFNLNLSENRANAVKNYLVKQGISAERIKSTGFGSEKPISSNATENGRAQNRRVEVVLEK